MKRLVVTLVGLTLALAMTAGVVFAMTGDGTPTPQPDPQGPVDEPSDEGGDQYEVTVRFNTSITQDGISEVDALLRTFDDDLQFLVMESFPPIGRAVLGTDAPSFCESVGAELEAKSYVDGVSCQPWEERNVPDPEAPVSNYNDTGS